jgi:cold shock CspA family protein
MAKSSATFNKRENEKRRIQKRKDKEQRKEDRKAGKETKSFEDMLAYVDENGNLTSTQPDPSKKKVINEAEIDLTSRNKGGALPPAQQQGTVKHYDSGKGYGFIRDTDSGEEFFFHHSGANYPISHGDTVTFETEMGPRGLNAVRISKASPAAGTPSEQP